MAREAAFPRPLLMCLLTPHPSLLIPHSSFLTPHSSSLTPHLSFLSQLSAKKIVWNHSLWDSIAPSITVVPGSNNTNNNYFLIVTWYDHNFSSIVFHFLCRFNGGVLSNYAIRVRKLSALPKPSSLHRLHQSLESATTATTTAATKTTTTTTTTTTLATSWSFSYRSYIFSLAVSKSTPS